MDVREEKSKLGRPRSQQSWEAVITATQSLMQTEGYRNLTMEGIAKAAGVGKPTLYRWWPNVPSIVMEAIKREAETEIGIPDTGTLKTDLLQYLGQTCHHLTDATGEFVRFLMAETQFNPDFAQAFRDEFIASRRKNLIHIFQEGVKRGELRQETDFELLADLCYGSIWYRLLNRHALLNDSFVKSLVDFIAD